MQLPGRCAGRGRRSAWSAAARAAIPIKHVIVVMKENRSFDHMLGRLHDRGQPDAEPVPPTFANLDPNGVIVRPFPLASTCVPHDPAHQWNAMHAQINGGKMDGFVEERRPPRRAPAGTSSWADTTTAICPFTTSSRTPTPSPTATSRPARAGTFPNRDFLYLATSADGVTVTGKTNLPDPSTPTIFDALDTAGVSWGVYADAQLLDGALGWTHSHVGTHPLFPDLPDGAR